jgi:hypothetical protein
MAMPLSGSLGIKSCPDGGACTSIAQAVDGNTSGNKSLTTLSVSTGKVAPHSMLEFYGYTTAPTNPTVSILLLSDPVSESTCCCVCGCLITSNVMPSNDCYFPDYCWRLCANNESNSHACVSVICNNTSIYSCAINNCAIFDCNGTWTTTARKVDCNDCIHIVTGVYNGTIDSSVMACVQVTSITQCVGTYCLGSPSSQASILS